MRGYTTAELAELLGLPPARIRAFAKAGFTSGRRTRRGRYLFSFEDVVLMRAAKELWATGVSTRRVFAALRRLRATLPKGQSLASVRIEANGHQVVVRDRGGPFEPGSGQFTFAFSVAELASRVEPLVRQAARQAQQDDLSSDEWFDLGVDLETVGALDDARAAYRAALALAPDHADALVNLGRLVHESGDLGEARALYERALAAAPADATAAFNLAILLEDLQQPDEARRLYHRAIEAAPDFADAHYNLAQLCERQGDAAAALRYLARYRGLTKFKDGQ